MNAGSIDRRGWPLVLSGAVFLGACERLTAEPPPPPSRHEVPAAPPAALGAHVASSPGMPALVEAPPSSPAPDSESEDEPEPTPHAGKDAGAPPAPEGVTL